MLCNMDQKIFRSFSLRTAQSEKGASAQVLQMYSSVEGEYGPVNFLISAEMEVQEPVFVARFLETSGASPEFLHSVRLNEISYFVSRILPLFNPLTVFHDEVPFPSASQSQNS